MFEEGHHQHLFGVCRTFQKGVCTRGAICKFSHDEQHEKHDSKKNPENAHKHRIEEEIAAAAAVGAGGYAFPEKLEKKYHHLV